MKDDSRPPLPKLWPERFGEAVTLDAIMSDGAIRVPAWRDLVPQAQHLDADILDVQQFVGLPSVRPYMEMALKVAKQAQRLFPYQPRNQWSLVEIYTIFALRRWEHLGKRVFVLDEQTFDLLRTTPLPEMPARRLVMPSQAFYLKFPDGLKFNIGRENLQPLEGAMVVNTHGVDRSGKECDELLIIACGKSSKGPEDDNVAYVTFYMNDRNIEELYVPPEEFMLPEGGEAVGVVTPRTVINFCLYMMTEQPLLEPVPPPPPKEKFLGRTRSMREAARQAGRGRSRLGFIRVGQKPEKRVYAKGTGKRLDMPVPVRAHWRWQAFGPGWKERKLILVEEHWRGIAFDNTDAPLRAGRIQTARRKHGTGE